MSDEWSAIRYRDFHDVPRVFVVERGRDLLLFDCAFDEALDDYGDTFVVSILRDDVRHIVDEPSWSDLGNFADRIGSVPVRLVAFDETKRRAIRTSVFDLMVSD